MALKTFALLIILSENIEDLSKNIEYDRYFF